ncbi:CHAT domain-containing protein [Sphingobium yanoikuyae]|uniref:CHAT domain-containing protein n=1 Tax=Sphingobium yanoikuyae TaxID=13690 RepID=A0AA43BAB8_SPHYA|nr:CHAT domain-containing protein [Sphingobium yanoikuyae]MDH2131998.1 CHAT domain-containing protein [Sphingobium yanoikuyae]MDH2151708.1 CHAT domain-containing protein [Sphingobium yanoikuyae]
MTDDHIDYGVFSWEAVEELTAKVLARLAREIPGQVDSLKITLSGKFARIEGQVHSEHARTVAIRMVAAFLTKHEIKAEIEVAGTLEPATNDWYLVDPWDNSGDDGKKGSSGNVPPNASPVIRYPEVSTSDKLIAGHEVTITIDLKVHCPDVATSPLNLGIFEQGWNKIEVMAQVSSSAFEAVGGEGRITIFEDGTSKAALITIRLRSDLPIETEVVVEVGFSHQGRFCGSHSFSVGKLTGPAQSGRMLSPITVLPAEIAEAPTLTVRIIGQDRNLTWLWHFAPGVSGPAGTTFASHELGTSPAQYAAELIRDCPQTLPTDLKSRMGSIGDEIWEATPREFRDAYEHLRSKLGEGFPIQFVLDQFHIPWELMRPATGNHLFLSHPVGRWSLRRGDVPHRIPSGEKYSFVPEYDANGTLPAAREEQKWLVANLGARKATAEKAEFVKLLSGDNMPKTSLIHFAGHGAAASESNNASLEMEDVPVQIRDVNHRDTKLGDRDRTMVILNACEAATVKEALSWADGWAPMFADRGFGAVVAPLWRVQDKAACDLVIAGLEGFYSRGETIGEAFSSARLAGASVSSAAFAFLVYGDVMARVE